MRLAAGIDRGRRWCLDRLPATLVTASARALAYGRPLGIEPGWRFDIGAEDRHQLTRLRRNLWTYYRDRRIDEPVIFRWYDDLRIRLFLGNDLSLCLYAGGSFEPNEFALLSAVLRPGMVFLDGGANDGLYSLFAARRVGPEGLVISVEPSGREIERLRANVELNGLTNAQPRRLALGTQAGTATLSIAEHGHEGQNTLGLRVSNPTVETVGHETVPMETIDNVVSQMGLTRLDFIKLDVEGSEVDALSGARATIGRFRPLMLLEAEDERLASQHRTKADFVAMIDDLGYELWVFDQLDAQLRPARRPTEPEGNTVAAPFGWEPPRLS